jgi:uncharacterized Tic20 family protein
MIDPNTNSYTGQGQVYVPTSDERTMAILSHILAIVSGFLAPLIIYVVKKDESKYVAEHAKESLNFQLTVLILCIVLCISIIGLIIVWLVPIVALIFEIIAAINASDNKIYRYPLSIRLIK